VHADLTPPPHRGTNGKRELHSGRSLLLRLALSHARRRHQPPAPAAAPRRRPSATTGSDATTGYHFATTGSDATRQRQLPTAAAFQPARLGQTHVQLAKLLAAVNVFKAIHCHPGSRRNAARAPAHAWTLEARRQAQRVARLPLPGTRFKLAGTRSYNGCHLFGVRKRTRVKYRNEACYFVLALSSTGVQVPTASTSTSDRSRVFNPRGSAKPTFSWPNYWQQ